MKVLVTGPTGFIGSHLTEELLKSGHEVACLVRKTSDLKWLENLDVSLKEGDCRDHGSLEEAASGADYVFHLAGLTKAPKEEDFFDVNVRGTENLLRAVQARCPSLRKFVFMSSLAAAGPSRKGKPVTEDAEPRPVSSYGRSKLEAERAVMSYSQSMPVTVIRPPAVYGPRDKDFYVLYRMLNMGIFPYWGVCQYSLVYVEDLVRGLISAAESDVTNGKTFFISEEKPYSNLDIARVIAESLGKRPIRIPLPKSLVKAVAGMGRIFGMNNSIINVDKARELKYSNWVCDPAKAQKELGFSPQITMDKGFKWTANWYRIHQWL